MLIITWSHFVSWYQFQKCILGEFADYILETSGSVQTILANQTHEKKVEVIKAITEAARKYADMNTGIVKFENEAILIVGRKWMNNLVKALQFSWIGGERLPYSYNPNKNSYTHKNKEQSRNLG